MTCSPPARRRNCSNCGGRWNRRWRRYGDHAPDEGTGGGAEPAATCRIVLDFNGTGVGLEPHGAARTGRTVLTEHHPSAARRSGAVRQAGECSGRTVAGRGGRTPAGRTGAVSEPGGSDLDPGAGFGKYSRDCRGAPRAAAGSGSQHAFRRGIGGAGGSEAAFGPAGEGAGRRAAESLAGTARRPGPDRCRRC